MSMLQENEPSQDSVYGLTGTPRTMFFLGLSMGVGSMAVIALAATVVFMMNGPVGVFAKDADTNTAAQVADAGAGNPSDPSAGADAGADTPSQPVPEVTKDDHVRGKDSAKVTLIEYSDFQCPYCVRHEDTMKAIAQKYPNDVRIVYRHFPLSSLHPFAQKAAEASECANAQGKFWEMHDKIFALTGSTAGLTLEGIKNAAKELKLDEGKFNTCLDKGEMTSKVSKMYQDGMASGVSGTPAVFINGKIVEGAVPLEQFEPMVTAAGAKS
jgi:protein-disulfide isomerase